MRNLITLLLTLSLAACSAAEPATARPAMWKLHDPDTTIYLFGTVHVLPDKLAWRTPRFDAAVRDSQALVLEIADQGDKARLADVYRRLAFSPGLPPILDRVPAEKRAALTAMIEKSGLKAEHLDQMETWAVAVALGASMYGQIGATADAGVENQLRNSFAGKAITGLETTEQQLGYFDTMPEESQRKLLVSMVDDSATAAADFKKMVTAWSSGNTRAIARTFDNELKKAPEIAEVLIDRRNANWVHWLKERLDQPGVIMVAVGAGHLAGEDSVIDQLRKQGMRVERVQ